MQPTGRREAPPDDRLRAIRENAEQSPGFRKSCIRATVISTSSSRENAMARLEGLTAIVVGAGPIGPGWGNCKATAAIFAREGAPVFSLRRNQAAAPATAP